MMPAPAAARKSSYRPHIRKVSDTAYTVQSERYVYVLYLVTARPDGSTCCDCTAGSFGRSCKHSKAVASYLAYRANPLHLRPATSEVAAVAPFVSVPEQWAWA